MKKIFAVISILLASVYSFAQELTFRSVCDGLAKNRTTKGEFIQEKTIGKTGRVLKSKGKFIFCREGILWSTEKPFPSTLVVGQDYMVRVSSDGTRKTMDAKDNDVFKSISSSMMGVFSNDVAILENEFDVVFTTDENNVWTAVLEPKDSTAAIFMKQLILKGRSSGGHSEMDSVELNEAKGNKVLYAFMNQSHPEELGKDEKSYFLER